MFECGQPRSSRCRVSAEQALLAVLLEHFENPPSSRCPSSGDVVWLPFTDGLKAELVQAAEGSQAMRGKGSFEHVEVFQMDNLGTSILEDLSRRQRRAALT